MLLQFNFTNYMSFKNECVLSMIANKDREHKDILISCGKENVLPSVSIYGSNAAGKTNINKALVFAIMFVRNSNLFQVDNPINVVPFLLDDNSRNAKSRFDFIFMHNGIKFEYGFELDRNKVYEEYLYEYKTSKPSLIFERSNCNQYKFSSVTKKELSAIENKNTDNKLFLSTATAWNSQCTKNAYLWFSEGIDAYNSSDLEQVFLTELENNNYESMQSFMKQLLKNADLNISDYDFQIREGKIENIPLPNGIKFDEQINEQLRKAIREWRLTTHHMVKVNDEFKDYPLPFNAESKGTINLFYLGPIIKKTLEKGKTMVIDEIDSGLHPLLVKYLISLFNNHQDNPNGAQLIFNTHDISQLTLDQFRRDQIYFVEKDFNTGISDLYSLDEYSPRKSENVQKGYLQGRYGAIPVIGIEEIKW